MHKQAGAGVEKKESTHLDKAIERAQDYLRRERERPTTAGQPNYERNGSHVIVGRNIPPR